MLGHIALAVYFIDTTLGYSLASEQLALAAKAAGCDNGGQVVVDWEGPDFPNPDGNNEPVRESEAMSCLLKLWYSRSRNVGPNAGLGNIKEAVYGEILPIGLNKVFKTVGNMGVKMNDEDTFVDLGSGAGKAVLQAHLMTPASRVVGVELSELHHRNAVSALEQMVADGVHDTSRKIDFINGDIRKYSDWSDGTVIFFNNLCFDADKLLPFAWDLPKSLQPGSVLVVTKQLPGCHPGLIHAQTTTIKTSWSHALPNGKDGASAYVYMVAPTVLRPEVQWLVPDDALKASPSSMFASERMQKSPDELVSPSAFATLGSQEPGLRGSPLHRFAVLSGATKSVALKEAPLDWTTTAPPVESFRWGDLIDTAVGAVNHGDSFECVLKDLGASTPYLSFGQKWAKPEPDDRSPKALLGQVLSNVVDINMPKSDDKETLLHFAVGRGFHRLLSSDALVGGLLELKADVNRKDAEGKTPLHAAAKWSDDLASMASLVKARADVNAQDDEGRTVLHEAVRASSEGDTAALLVHVRADINLLDNSGRAPLHVAAKYGNMPVAELLLGKNAVVEPRDQFGRTPLHEAAESNQREMAQFLVDNGADISTKDNFGMTAF